MLLVLEASVQYLHVYVLGIILIDLHDDLDRNAVLDELCVHDIGATGRDRAFGLDGARHIDGPVG